MSVTVAGIDCGTNSIRLMIARMDETDFSVVVPRIMRVVRLGEGMDVHHEFSRGALERVFAAIDEFAQIIAEHDVDLIRFVATSATRDARNRDEFEQYVHEKMGVYPDVISGDEEARLSFLGAISVLDVDKYTAPFMVVDLGGGSTELVIGGDGIDMPADTVAAAYSMNIGSVRMSERHNLSDGPDEASIEAATADIDAHIHQAAQVVPLHKVRTIIGVSGTVTTMSALVLDQTEYVQKDVDGTQIDIEAVTCVNDRVLRMTRAERDTLTVVHPGRRDVIGAGALVWSRVLTVTAESAYKNGTQICTYIASEHGLLDGIVRDMAYRAMQ